MTTPLRWDPAGHPVHRLIQTLDTLAVSVLRFQQCTFGEPFYQGTGASGYDHNKRCHALRRLREEHRAVADRLFPRGLGGPQHVAAALADAAVAYFAARGRTEAEAWVRQAAGWMAGAGMWTPATGEPTGGDFPRLRDQFTKEQEAVLHMRTVRANLLAELARCGQRVPEAIYGRVDLAPLPPLPPGKTTISVEELLRWADEAQPSGSPPESPPSGGRAGGEGGAPALPERSESRTAALVADAELARRSKDRDGELGRERERLWAEYLGAFSPLRVRWFAAWRPVAAAVDAGDAGATAAALAVVAGVLAEIDRATADWADKACRWLRAAKQNNSAWGCLAPADHQPAFVSDTACWADRVARAGGVREFAAKTPVAFLESAYARPQAVLIMLAEGATAEQFARLFRAWGGVDCLRGVTAALAMSLVLPDDGHQFDPCELPSDDKQRALSVDLLRIALHRLDSPDLQGVVDRYFSRRPSTQGSDPAAAEVSPSLSATGKIPASVRHWLQLKFLADPTPDPFPTAAGTKRVAFVRFDEFAAFLMNEGLEPLPLIDLVHRAGWILDIRIDIHPATSDAAPEPCPGVQRVAVRLALGPGEHRVIGIPETICEPSPGSPPAGPAETGGEGRTPPPNPSGPVTGVDEAEQTPPPDPFPGLRRWASKELKGKQRAAIEAICDAGGQVPIADLGAASGVDWSDAKKGFDNLKYQLGKELKARGWKLYRHDNEARLEIMPHSKGTQE